jgi:protein-S-isoprenylcysteine O-methyltransferase Ste14
MNSPLARVIIVFIGLIVSLFIFLRGPGPHGPLRWIGLILALLGVVGVVVARWTLGKSFSVRPQARQLVTHGIYLKIRNPIYVFSVVCIAGVLLMIQQKYAWIWLGVVIVVQTLRARQESSVLEAKFGDEYREYRRKTWL